jgi:hypothetical protein
VLLSLVTEILLQGLTDSNTISHALCCHLTKIVLLFVFVHRSLQIAAELMLGLSLYFMGYLLLT